MTGTAVEEPRVAQEPVAVARRRRVSAATCAFWLILVVAAAARLWRFPSLPNGLNQDEASAGYETLSLLAAGTDRWGNRWPVYFTAFGSGQNVLQSYLNMPFVAVFGPTPLGVRLLPALLGVASVAMIYALTARMAGRRAGLIAAALLALCPWHVMMSRWSLESNMLPPVMLLAVWVLVVAYSSERRWPLVLSLAPMALVFYAYAAATFVVFLFVAAFLVIEFRTARRRPLAVAGSIGIFGLLSLPYALFLLVNEVLHRTPGWLSWLPFGLQVLPGRRLDEIDGGSLIEQNLRFVLGGFDDHRPWNVLSPYLPLGLIVLPLAAAGVWFGLRSRGSRAWVPVVWLAATVPMAGFVPLNVNRLNVAFVPLIVLAAIGLDGIARGMREARAGIAVLTALMAVALLYNAAFVRDYFARYDAIVAVPFSEGLDRALDVAVAQGGPVYVSDHVLLNYLYVLFYRDVDPEDFQTNSRYAVEGTKYQVYHYRDFYFRHADPALAAAPSYVALFRRGEKAECAGGGPQRLLAVEGVFRVVRCR